MLFDDFIYETHSGTRFVGSENGVYMGANDLRDYEWSLSMANDQIAGFNREVIKKMLPLRIAGFSKEQATEVKNMLTTLFEQDVAARQPGKVWLGDWFLRGYVTKSSKANYNVTKRYAEFTCELTCDSPVWQKETIFVYLATNTSETTSSKAYSYRYPYQYGNSLISSSLTNQASDVCKFQMVIYGPCSDPSVYIAGHEYNVNVTLQAGQRLSIDSREKTILMSDVDGTMTNCIHLRKRDSYIFQPIPVGTSPMIRSANFGVDLTLIEERSEPKWT